MFNKDYIRDKGVIRYCPANVAKMNIFELIYLKTVIKKSFFKNIFYTYKDIFNVIGEGVVGLFWLVANTIIILSTPISLPIICWFEMRRAKKEVEEYNRERD